MNSRTSLKSVEDGAHGNNSLSIINENNLD
jgi:hypothetical protein